MGRLRQKSGNGKINGHASLHEANSVTIPTIDKENKESSI